MIIFMSKGSTFYVCTSANTYWQPKENFMEVIKKFYSGTACQSNITHWAFVSWSMIRDAHITVTIYVCLCQ